MTLFVRDEFGDIYRDGAPRRRSHLDSRAVRVTEHERDEDYDVLVSLFEGDWGIVEEALPVLEQFRRGRTRRWELDGNVHSLELTSRTADIQHMFLKIGLRLSLVEFGDAVREWIKFQRELSRLVHVTFQLQFNSELEAAEAERLLRDARFVVGRMDECECANGLFALVTVETEEDADPRLAQALSRESRPAIEYRMSNGLDALRMTGKRNLRESRSRPNCQRRVVLPRSRRRHRRNVLFAAIADGDGIAAADGQIAT